MPFRFGKFILIFLFTALRRSGSLRSGKQSPQCAQQKPYSRLFDCADISGFSEKLSGNAKNRVKI